MSKISILIIGAGEIAKQHLNSLCKIKEINLYGIYSRTKNKSEDLASKYKIKNIYSNYENIKSNIDNIDIIMVLVNPDQIIKVFQKIKNFKKFIFFEKPVGINYSQTRIIAEEIDKLKIRTFVGFNRRYYSNLSKGLKKLKLNGKKITSIIIEGNERIWLVKKYKKNLKNLKFWPYINSIHTVDLIRFLVGEIDYKNFSRLKSKNSFYAIMQSKSGILINYTSNYDYYDSWVVKIYNNFGEYLYLKPLELCKLISHNSEKIINSQKIDKYYKFGFRNMHNDLIKSYFETENLSKYRRNTVADALKSVKLINKIFYSNAS